MVFYFGGNTWIETSRNLVVIGTIDLKCIPNPVTLVDIVFTVLVFVKESVLGGDAFWWVYLQGCF